MSRKSQITIFLLLGIVIVFIFAFLFYVRVQALNTISKGNLKKTVDSMLASTPVKLYIESCLEKGTEQGLVLVGMQGGWIYNNQVEGTPRWRGPPERDYASIVIPYKGQNVSYGIYKKSEDPPEYPYGCNESSLNPADGSQAFGPSNLLELCDNQGLNAWDLPGAEYSCIRYDVLGSSNTIQEYLGLYIANKTKECVDIKTLRKELGYDIEEGKVNVRVLFGEDDVLVTADYEMTINIKSESITRLGKYSVNPKVRFKKIYELAYYMIQREINNIFFDIADEESLKKLNRCPNQKRNLFNQPCLLPNMSVELVKDPCFLDPSVNCIVSEYSDIIRITDNQSLINDQPYVFQFGIKNRAPALDWIDESITNTSQYYYYLEERYGLTPADLYHNASSGDDPTNYNIVAYAGSDIVIYPRAIDPDGDKITYKYSGWKTQTQIKIGAHWKGGGDINRWEGSTKYVDTLRDAFVTTNASDQGYQYLRITVFDGEGLSDYQDIRILLVSPS